MITDYNVTSYYNDYCYEDYYKKSKDWDRYYDAMAEKADREREDNCDE